MAGARRICWFSAGAASAVASYISLMDDPQTLIVRCIVGNEHEDNDRFTRDCEKWFGKKIIEIRSSKYRDCWDVWEKRRFLNSPRGATCTVEMKKNVRKAYQLPGDIQSFGFTIEETKRAERFARQNPDIVCRFPLLSRHFSKTDCLRQVQLEGIQLPLMYRMGYRNANCVGCVKGGMGYWNKIRRDFPNVFQRMADLEKRIGATCIKKVSLADLPENVGRYPDLVLPPSGFDEDF